MIRRYLSAPVLATALLCCLASHVIPAHAGDAAPEPEAMHAALKAANPGYEGGGVFRNRDGALYAVSLMRCLKVTTTAPLADFDLSTVQNAIFYQAIALTDLSGLRGATRLTNLNVERCRELADLSPVADLPIGWLRMYALPKMADIKAVEKMPLYHLDMGACPLIDDLSPIRGKNLKDLRIDDCPKITDISLLEPMKELEVLSIFNCPGIEDYSVLAKLKLKTLLISPELMSPEELAIVRQMEGLEILGSDWLDWRRKMTPEQFWARYDSKHTDAPQTP